MNPTQFGYHLNQVGAKWRQILSDCRATARERGWRPYAIIPFYRKKTVASAEGVTSKTYSLELSLGQVRPGKTASELVRTRLAILRLLRKRRGMIKTGGGEIRRRPAVLQRGKNRGKPGKRERGEGPLGLLVFG